MKINVAGFFTLLLALTVSFTQAQNITGTWYTPSDGGEYITLDDYGRLKVQGVANGSVFYGYYAVVENVLSVSFLNGNSATYTISQYSGNRFRLEDYEGTSWVYTYFGDSEMSAKDLAHFNGGTNTTQNYNVNGFASIPDVSGRWYNPSAGETIMLSASEYFEIEGKNGDYHGIWGINGQNLELGFVQGGNIAAFEVDQFIPKRLLRLIGYNANGQKEYWEYRYQGSAPTYDRQEVIRVLNDLYAANSSLNQNYQMQMEMMNAQHRTTMSIIHAMGGYDTKYIERDAYGNIIREY